VTDVRSQLAAFDLGRAKLTVTLRFSGQPGILLDGSVDPTMEPFAEQARPAVVKPPNRGARAYMPTGLGKQSPGDWRAVPTEVLATVCLASLMCIECALERGVELVSRVQPHLSGHAEREKRRGPGAHTGVDYRVSLA
jgi:hypothetical protein